MHITFTNYFMVFIWLFLYVAYQLLVFCCIFLSFYHNFAFERMEQFIFRSESPWYVIIDMHGWRQYTVRFPFLKINRREKKSIPLLIPLMLIYSLQLSSVFIVTWLCSVPVPEGTLSYTFEKQSPWKSSIE